MPAAQMIEREAGVLVYLRQHEGRGIGLQNRLRAYKLQDEGLNTIEANERLGFPPDVRDFGVGAEILADLGVRRVRFLTNNPDKAHGNFDGSRGRARGLELVSAIALEGESNERNRRYLEMKRARMGHLLQFQERASA